jgi:hypothetical protein
VNDTKTVTLSQILTDAQIDKAFWLYKICVSEGLDISDAVTRIQVQVIEPNLHAINAKLGQENDAHYLAYVVLYAFTQIKTEEQA